MKQYMEQATIDFNNYQTPIPLFNKWFEQARKEEISDSNAFALATVNSQGQPNIRIVLLKSYDDNNFTFYTNLQSTKGKEIFYNPNVAMNFHWKSMERQIRIQGIAQLVAEEDAANYFSTRPYLSKIGARVSAQSRPLPSRQIFEKKIKEEIKRFPISQPVPKPDYWSGFSIKPLTIEFWQAETSRLHERIIYTRDTIDANIWKKTRLYP